MSLGRIFGAAVVGAGVGTAVGSARGRRIGTAIGLNAQATSVATQMNNATLQIRLAKARGASPAELQVWADEANRLKAESARIQNDIAWANNPAGMRHQRRQGQLDRLSEGRLDYYYTVAAISVGLAILGVVALCNVKESGNALSWVGSGLLIAAAIGGCWAAYIRESSPAAVNIAPTTEAPVYLSPDEASRLVDIEEMIEDGLNVEEIALLCKWSEARASRVLAAMAKLEESK